MTNIAIHAHASRSMAVHAPSHRLIYFAAHSMHLPNLTVTRRAVDSGSNVRFVRVVSVRFRFDPIDATPRRLLFSLSVGRELLNLRAFSLDRLVATHARGNVWDRRVRRLVYVFVTERAFKLWSFFPFLSDVLPVIELDRLQRRFRLSRSAQQHEADH